MIRHGMFMAIGVLLLPGCVSLDLPGASSSTPVVQYVLEDAGRTAPAATPSSKTLIIVDTQASTFYDNDGMAYSREPGTRGYYQFARWTERPGKRFTDLLIARLDQEKLFAAVAQTGTNVYGNWLLTTDIIELYHDAVKQPGTVKMVLRAEVTDLDTRKLLSRKNFTQTIPAPSYDAAGAYQAFNQAATTMLNDIADWLKSLSAKT